MTGGLLEHREWSISLNMEKNNSPRTVTEYEANITNEAGYWMAFHKEGLGIRQECLDEG